VLCYDGHDEIILSALAVVRKFIAIGRLVQIDTPAV
jgi:hypothetical protein